MKEQSDLKATIKKLKDDLDRSYREMADGVRDWLSLQAAYRQLQKQSNHLREMTVELIMERENCSLKKATASVQADLERRLAEKDLIPDPAGDT